MLKTIKTIIDSGYYAIVTLIDGSHYCIHEIDENEENVYYHGASPNQREIIYINPSQIAKITKDDFKIGSYPF